MILFRKIFKLPVNTITDVRKPPGKMTFFFCILLFLSTFMCSSDLEEVVGWKEVLDDTISFEAIDVSLSNLNNFENSLEAFDILSDNEFKTSLSEVFKDTVNEKEEKESFTHTSDNKEIINIKSCFNGETSYDLNVLFNDDILLDNDEKLNSYSFSLKENQLKKQKRGHDFCTRRTNSCNYKQHIFDIKNDIKRKIKEQLPNVSSYSLRNFEIQNWPKEVDPLANYWTRNEIEMIKYKFNDLIFIYRPKPGLILEKRIQEVKDGSIFAELLKRFKVESGFSNANFIEWGMVDRSQLPEEHQNIKLNIKIVDMAVSYGFLENLHFYKYAAFYLPRLEWANQQSKGAAAIDYYVHCREVLLEKFRRESRHENANNILWLRIDISKLPEKYRQIKLSNVIVFDKGLFKDPEFFENVHFLEYFDHELRTLFLRLENREKRKIIDI